MRVAFFLLDLRVQGLDLMAAEAHNVIEVGGVAPDGQPQETHGRGQHVLCSGEGSGEGS